MKKIIWLLVVLILVLGTVAGIMGYRYWYRTNHVFVGETVYEKELTSMERTNTGDRMTKAMAEFCTGVLDPKDDAAWAKYVKELEVNGESDLLEAAQSAYTRMVG